MAGPAENPPPAPAPRSVGLLGARRVLRDVEAENAMLRGQIGSLESELQFVQDRDRREADRLRRDNDRLRQDVLALRNRDAVAYEREAEHAAARLGQVQASLAAATDAVRAEEQRGHEIAELNRALLARALETADDVVTAARAAAGERARSVEAELAERHARLAELDRRIVETADIAMLQEAGVYEFRHRLDDVVAYKSRLDDLRDRYKTMIRGERAVLAASGWTVNGSATEGRRMLKDYTKLMLRAYNAEADNCVRTMRPHRLSSSIDRLTKARDTIAKLGRTMEIRVSEDYHRARIEELELTSDHLVKQEEEKERIRAERERQRDEDTARKEFEREKARLVKEQSHWQLVQERWRSQGDEAKVAEAQGKLDQLGSAIEGVEAREANIRTGHVYVISNLGAFGEDMVKIGMTRRLDPNDRVRELGDASVPFRFDVHALVFSSDAVALETHLHRELADRRVNRVNLRREFFRATPAEVLDVLRRSDQGDNVLEFTEIAEAQEWRASIAIAEGSAPLPV